MATSPTGNSKPKRTQGPRQVKDKAVFLVSSQDITDLQVFNEPEGAMNYLMDNPGFKVKKHVIPVKRRPAANQAPAA